MVSQRIPLVLLALGLVGAVGLGLVAQSMFADPARLAFCEQPLADDHHEAPEGDSEPTTEKEDQEDPYVSVLRGLKAQSSLLAPAKLHLVESQILGRQAVFQLLRPPRAG